MRRTLIATALLAALAAGCGSQPSGVASVRAATATPSASATPTADAQEQGRKFAQCMREHGVPMEDPGPDGGGGLSVIGGDKDKTTKALEACRDHAPFKDRQVSDPEDIEQLRAFAQCMRENGVDLPDPNPDGTFGKGAANKIDRDDPQFTKALQACRAKFPRTGAGK